MNKMLGLAIQLLEKIGENLSVVLTIDNKWRII